AGMGEACPCCRTNIATTDDGTLYLAWRQVYPGNIRDVVVAHSSDKGATWSEPVRVPARGSVAAGRCKGARARRVVDGEGGQRGRVLCALRGRRQDLQRAGAAR